MQCYNSIMADRYANKGMSEIEASAIKILDKLFDNKHEITEMLFNIIDVPVNVDILFDFFELLAKDAAKYDCLTSSPP